LIKKIVHLSIFVSARCIFFFILLQRSNTEYARQLNENLQHAYLSIKQIKIIDCYNMILHIM